MTTRPRLVHIVTVPLSFWLVRGQANVMRNAGFEVHSISSPGPLADDYTRDNGVPVHTVAMARRISPWADLVSLLRLLATLRRIAPQVVQAGTPKAGLLGTIAAWVLRVPRRIYYVHGLPTVTATGLRRLLLLATDWLSCAAATDVVCVSHSVKRELVASGACPADKAIVLGNGSCNGVDLAWFDRARLPVDTAAQVRARLGIPRNALVIGFIGRLGREKGIDELRRAWRTLRQRCPSAYLLLIGPPEATDPPPPGTLAELAVDPRVRIPGEDWDTAPLYTAMDVFCLPSYREGCPNVALEAASMELPIVAFRVSGVVDAVADGVTGQLVDPFDVEGLATALQAYLEDDRLRTQHGQAARRHVGALFSRALVWQTLLIFYSSLVSQRGTLPGRATECTDAV